MELDKVPEKEKTDYQLILTPPTFTNPIIGISRCNVILHNVCIVLHMESMSHGSVLYFIHNLFWALKNVLVARLLFLRFG